MVYTINWRKLENQYDPFIVDIVKRCLKSAFGKIHYKDNTETIKNRTKEWCKNNPQRKNENYSRWVSNNIDKCKKHKKKHYLNNRDMIIERSNIYYSDNIEYIRTKRFEKKLESQGLSILDYTLPDKYISQLENTISQSLERLDYNFKKVKPLWLINDRTGRRLELDFYCEELKLAIEVQGRQHYISMHYDNEKENLSVRQYRDQVKRNTCKRLGIVLIEHKYNERVDVLIEAIQLYIDLNT